MSTSNSAIEKEPSKYDEDLEGNGIRVLESENAGSGHMHRSLKGRQVSMIAIAGTIGTGCRCIVLLNTQMLTSPSVLGRKL